MRQRFITGLGLLFAFAGCSPLAPSLSKATTLSQGGEAESMHKGVTESRAHLALTSLRVPVLLERARGRPYESNWASPFTLELSHSQIQEFKQSAFVELELPHRAIPDGVQGVIQFEMPQSELNAEGLSSMITLYQESEGGWKLKVRESADVSVSKAMRDRMISFSLLFASETTSP